MDSKPENNYYYELEEDFSRMFKVLKCRKSLEKIWIYYKETCATKTDKPIMNEIENDEYKKNIDNTKVCSIVNNYREKKIHFNTSNLLPYNIHYRFGYDFYPNTSNGKAILIFKQFTEDPISMSIGKEVNDSENHLNYFHIFSKAFRKCLNGLNQLESAFIKGNIETMWDLLRDFNKLIKIVPEMGAEVKYESDSTNNTGTVINIKHSESVSVKLKVKNCKNTKKAKELVLASSEINKHMPLQEIHFTLIKHKTGFLIKFKHVFLQYIRLSDFQKHISLKVQILKKLKAFFEERSIRTEI